MLPQPEESRKLQNDAKPTSYCRGVESWPAGLVRLPISTNAGLMANEARWRDRVRRSVPLSDPGCDLIRSSDYRPSTWYSQHLRSSRLFSCLCRSFAIYLQLVTATANSASQVYSMHGSSSSSNSNESSTPSLIAAEGPSLW